MDKKSPFRRAKTVAEVVKEPIQPHKSIKQQHAVAKNPSLNKQFEAPRKIEEPDVDICDDFLEEELPATQLVDYEESAPDADETMSETSDDEGDFRSLAHDVIQKNGYRTVQKWFELEAEPFRPKKKIVVTSK
jgi:hypothetical protein